MEKEMYYMKPYTADFVVEPKNILYKLQSYHNEDDGLPVHEDSVINEVSIQQLAISAEDEDEKQLELQIHQQQQALIVELTSFDKRLGAFIAKAKLESETVSSEQESKVFQTDKNLKKVEPVKDDSQNRSAPKQLKESGIDEPSKSASNKADKKAEKKEKKKQHSSTTAASSVDSVLQTRNPSDKKEMLPISSSACDLQILVQPPMSESPILVHAKLGAATDIFPLHDYYNHRIEYIESVKRLAEPIKLYCCEADIQGWVKRLAMVGKKRNVLFQFPGFSVQRDANSIAVEVVLVSESIPAKLHHLHHEHALMSVWKFFGSLLGVYCAEDVLVSTRMDQWLLWASELPINLDQFTRKMSFHLSRFDFLSGSNSVCLADLIVRSLFPAQWTDVEASNNVQLWVKRVDASLSLYC